MINYECCDGLNMGLFLFLFFPDEHGGYRF